MRIHCDYCGVEIDAETATAVQLDSEVLYFCSTACVEKSDYHETMADPGREDEGTAPDVR